ncbi:hypothetical protein NB603_18530 [Vibrio antiquarius]|nr:hypothetical protein [Vibrio antiquarius]MCR9982897.1 hypothetical protein [Vibrio alginolyticus]MCR9988584.1 hypothetical protein [Vibrio antiquarius]
MKPLGTANAAENGLTTPKSAFGKPISQSGLSTKSLKPRGTYNTRENVISASKSAFVPNKLTERSCNQEQTLDSPALSASMGKTTARAVTKLWTENS